MNWTGGRLARHSGAAKNTKQKQHFARAKQNLQKNAPGKAPIQWNILNKVVEEKSGAHWEARPPSPKSGHDDHQSYRYQTRQTHSNTPQPSTRKNPQANPTSLAKPQHHVRRDHYDEERKSRIQIKRERFDSEEIYDASPPPRHGKRKHEALEDGHNAERQQMEDAEERRRKLLRKTDWIGSVALAPPKVIFRSPTREGKFGRRRKITKQDQPCFEMRRTNIMVPSTRKGAANLIPSSLATSNKPLRKSDVRISIGGKAVPPGISPSTRPSRISHNSLQVMPAKMKRTSVSSSFMLLNNDENSPAVPETRETMTTKTVQPSSPPLRAHAFRGKHQSWESPNIGDTLSSGSLQKGVVSNYGYAAPQSENSTRYSNFSQDSHHSHHPHQPQHRQHPVLIPSPISAMKIRALNGDMTYSSSSVPVQQPIPRSFKAFSHFRSNSSDFAESNMAQIGGKKPVVPSSQVQENEVWRTWIAPPQFEDLDDDLESNRQSTRNGRVSMSPGITVLPTQRIYHHNVEQSSNNIASYSMYQQKSGYESTFASREVSEFEYCRQDDSAQFHELDTLSVGSPATTGSYESDAELEMNSEHRNTQEGEHIRTGFGKQAVIHVHQPTTTVQVAEQIKEIVSEAKAVPIDANARQFGLYEIWRQFVWDGNDDDDDDEAPPKSQRQKTLANKPKEELSSASILAQKPTANDWSSSSPQQSIDEDEVDQISVPTRSSPHPICNSNVHKKAGHKKHEVYKNKAIRAQSNLSDDIHSTQALRGTVAATSLDSPAASKRVVVNTSSPSSVSPSGYSAERSIVFTKPQTFSERRRSGMHGGVEAETMHIGKGLMERSERTNKRVNEGGRSGRRNLIDDIWESK